MSRSTTPRRSTWKVSRPPSWGRSKQTDRVGATFRRSPVPSRPNLSPSPGRWDGGGTLTVRGGARVDDARMPLAGRTSSSSSTSVRASTPSCGRPTSCAATCSLAEDLLQGALVKLARQWERVRDEAPDAYVRRILYRDAVSSWRKRRHEVVGLTWPGAVGRLLGGGAGRATARRAPGPRRPDPAAARHRRAAVLRGPQRA